MADGTNYGRDYRPIRIFTADGDIEGCLATSPARRTLDELNDATRSFLNLHRVSASERLDRVRHGAGAAIHKGSMLFVQELRDLPPEQRCIARANYNRVAVRAWIADHVVEGFMHVPPGGSPIPILNHPRPDFIAITEASVSTAGESFDAGFLAVRRSSIRMLQAVDTADAHDGDDGTTEGFAAAG